MSNRFCVNLTCAKDNSDKATVAFVVANAAIAQEFRLPYVPELVDRKIKAAEHQILNDADIALHSKEYERLRGELEEASKVSSLPESPSARPALNDLLKRVRMRTVDK